MKIKLAILEKDIGYLQRIVSIFSTRFSEKLELFSFTDPAVCLASLDNSRIDVLLASDVFQIDTAKLPKRCGFAYFVESPDVESVNGQQVICKFQKADLIYKQVLSLYSENAGNVSGLKFSNDTTRVTIFSSPCGGCGTSTMAAACAVHFASQGRKTAYLNLEKFGVADVFFNAEGQFDMSDIIYALKSKKSNLSIKLESCIKVSPEGVYFLTSPKLALDTMELNAEDIIYLIEEMKVSGGYDDIVVDLDFSLAKDTMDIYKKAHALIWVGDGSPSSNEKIVRAFQALMIMEQRADMPINNRILLLYNRFSNKTSKTADNSGIRNIGGAPRIEHATVPQLIANLSGLDAFDKIF